MIEKISIISICLCFVLPVYAESQGQQHSHSHKHTDKASKPNVTPYLGAAWNASNAELKKQFEHSYRSNKNKRAVYEEFLSSLGALPMLDYLELNNPRCHGEAHELGKAIFAQSKDLGKSLMVCENRCTNACMHGVVGEAFGGQKYNEVTKEMTDFCAKGEMANLHKAGNCAHGIGHALMIITEHDIEKSLQGCEKFDNTGMDYYCATGVFMEYRGLLRLKQQQGVSTRRPSRLYPCDKYTKYPAACYRYMLHRISSESDASVGEMVKLCLKLDARSRRGCFHGLGAMYSRIIAKKPKLLKEVCLKGNSEDQLLCIEGVIEKMADFSEKQARKLCHSLKGKNKNVCLAGAEEKMYRLNKNTMELYQ